MESLFIKAMALSDGAVFADNPGQYQEDHRRFGALTAAQVRTASDSWLAQPSYRLTVLPYGSHNAVADSADRTAIPALAPSPALKLPELKEARLSNGIRVLFPDRPGTPTVDLALVFDAGKAAEQHMKHGLKNSTFGLMDEGTVTFDARQFAERQALLDTRIWATASANTTDFGLSALTRKLPDSVALWADYVRNPGSPRQSGARPCAAPFWIPAVAIQPR